MLAAASSQLYRRSLHLHLAALPVLGDREHVELPVEHELRRARRGLISRDAGTGETIVLDFPGGRAGERISLSISHVPQDKTRTRVGFRWIG